MCVYRRRHRLATGVERVRGGAHIPKPQIMLQVVSELLNLKIVPMSILIVTNDIIAYKSIVEFQVWDRELAYLAQRLANQCNFVHDDCRATGKNTSLNNIIVQLKGA